MAPAAAVRKKFQQDRVKVAGKTGVLGETISVSRGKNRNSMVSESDFLKRYVFECLSLCLERPYEHFYRSPLYALRCMCM